jgi:tetratricopeptide (TPR) repeat protein
MVSAEVSVMRALWLTGLLLCAGCTPTVQERVRAINADGIFLFQRGDYDHARETFQAALDLTPDDPGVRFNLAQCHERLGDVDGAEKIYRACLKMDPDHAGSHHSLSVLLVRQKRREEAVRLVENWLKRQPRLAGPYAEDAWLWHEAGDLPRAQSRLQQALQFDPHNVQALNELGLVYEELARPDRALSLYDRSLADQPDQPDVIQRTNRLRAQGVTYPRPE